MSKWMWRITKSGEHHLFAPDQRHAATVSEGIGPTSFDYTSSLHSSAVEN